MFKAIWSKGEKSTINYSCDGMKRKFNNPKSGEKLCLGVRIPTKLLDESQETYIKKIQDMFMECLKNNTELLPFDQVSVNYYNHTVDIGLKIVSANYSKNLEYKVESLENQVIKLKEKCSNEEYFITKAFETIFDDSYKARLKNIITDKENEINLYDDIIRQVITKLNFKEEGE